MSACVITELVGDLVCTLVADIAEDYMCAIKHGRGRGCGSDAATTPRDQNDAIS